MDEFHALTEQWNEPMSPRQIDMAHTRYMFAREHCGPGPVLEIGCGSGFGLQLLRSQSDHVVGGDISPANAGIARRATHLPIVVLDAQQLPFRSGFFDVVVIFESIYYFPDITEALNECRRVLGKSGKLLLSLPNAQRPGFHPSPLSFQYPSTDGLHQLLRNSGFETVRYFGAYNLTAPSVRGRLIGTAFSCASVVARKLHMIPRTLAGRARIKRLRYGRLERLQALDPARQTAGLTELPSTKAEVPFATIYVDARVNEAS